MDANSGLAATNIRPKSLLTDVSLHHRARLVSGMRWTVWLSILGVPLSAGFNILLARLGPEILAVLGLLSVYIGLVSSVLYFGGDSVIIRFIPECRREERLPFLTSYLLLVFIWVSGWLIVGWTYPVALSLVLGHHLSNYYNLILVSLAPILIVFQMVVASLKGILELKTAQCLAKLSVWCSFGAYLALMAFNRSLLITHPQLLIWGIYLLFAAVLGCMGVKRLYRSCDSPHLDFFLPRGFWRYALDTQMVSAFSFAANRLDYIVIINIAGLAVLGRYVAIMTVASAVPLLVTFFLDNLLPALTNMIASRNLAGAAQIYRVHMRLLFLVSVSASCAIMALGTFILKLMGPKFEDLSLLILLSVLLRSIGAPGPSAGTVLASVNQQRLALWSSAFRILMFCLLLYGLWKPFGLAAVVIADGGSWILYGISLTMTAWWVSEIHLSIMSDWAKAAVIQALFGATMFSGLVQGVIAGSFAWLCASAGFFVISRYDWGELRELMLMFFSASEGS